MGTIMYGRAAALVSSRPSPIIWKDCPVVDFLKDPAKGFHVLEDFKKACFGATTVGGFRFYSFLETGSALVLADDEKGVVQLRNDTTANDSTTLVTGNNTTGCITPANESAKKWWFEVRFKTVSITTADIGFFLGLAIKGQAADTKPLADTTLVVNAISHVGFRVAADAGAALDFVWNLAGQTAQETASVQTLVANTWYRAGFKYDPVTNKVKVYIDGVENKDAAFEMSHASAPAACLAVCLSKKNGSGAASSDYVHIDWVRYASEY